MKVNNDPRSEFSSLSNWKEVQLLKLENSLRGSLFTFIYDRSSNI